MTHVLSERMDAIERFAADVAHEIKNPLTSLRSAVETLELVKDPVAQARLLNILQQDVTRLDRLVTDISNASRLDAELSREAPRAFELAFRSGEVLPNDGAPHLFKAEPPPGDCGRVDVDPHCAFLAAFDRDEPDPLDL